MQTGIITRVKETIVKYLSQSLLVFKQYTYGDEIFQELFYDRTDAKNKIFSALSTGENMTVIGNPGEGKTCLMHYMFIQAGRSDKIYPIIIDYRSIRPRDIYGVVAEFVTQMTGYFKEIGFPINELEELTTEANYKTHFRMVSEHLKSIKLVDIQNTKKLAIFLDDFDYFEPDYVSVLKEYFVSYSASDKAVVILSGRKPLMNTIAQDDELRQAFQMDPREIHLVRVDL